MMDAEALIERRRLRRKLSVWRVVAVLAVAVVAVALLWQERGVGSGERVARINVDGFIPTRPEAAVHIDKAAENDDIVAIVLRIDSPGGAATGGEALYTSVREAAAAKPVVAVIDGLGASAAYMTAIAADHVVARESAITGSIGVLFQFGNATELLDRIGVTVDAVKSAPLKAEPSPFSPTDPRAVAMLRTVVEDTYDWFKGLVAERRGLDAARVAELADGRILTGRQAAAAGLVDAVGGEDAARAWLAKEHGVSVDLDAVDWGREFGGFRFRISALARSFGIAAPLEELARDWSRRFTAEGLLMLWQPPGAAAR